MQLQIKISQPSLFPSQQFRPIKAFNLYPSKYHHQILIGREYQEKQEIRQNLINTHIYQLGHQSVSRKHARILMPKIQEEQGRNRLPLFYGKLKGRWREIGDEMWVKIRQYAAPQNVIIIQDMSSRYGVFTQTNKTLLTNKITNSNKNTPPTLTNPQTIQFGSQTISLLDIKQDLSFQQYRSYRQSVEKQHKKIKWIFNKVDKLEIFDKKLNNFGINLDDDKLFFCCVVLKEQKIGCGVQRKNEGDGGDGDGDGDGEVFGLIVSRKIGEESRKVVVGRHPCCDLQINKQSVSRKQAQFYCNVQGIWTLQDLKSTNSTWLKTKKLKHKLVPIPTVQNSKSIWYSESNESQMMINKSYKQHYQMMIDPLVIKLGEVRLDLKVILINQYTKENNRIKVQKGQLDGNYQRILIGIQ